MADTKSVEVEKLWDTMERILYDIDDVVYRAIQGLESANKRFLNAVDRAYKDGLITDIAADRIWSIRRQTLYALIKTLRNFREKHFPDLEDTIYDNLPKR
jgi:hypothetical protein